MDVQEADPLEQSLLEAGLTGRREALFLRDLRGGDRREEEEEEKFTGGAERGGSSTAMDEDDDSGAAEATAAAALAAAALAAASETATDATMGDDEPPPGSPSNPCSPCWTICFVRAGPGRPLRQAAPASGVCACSGAARRT